MFFKKKQNSDINLDFNQIFSFKEKDKKYNTLKKFVKIVDFLLFINFSLFSYIAFEVDFNPTTNLSIITLQIIATLTFLFYCISLYLFFYLKNHYDFVFLLKKCEKKAKTLLKIKNDFQKDINHLLENSYISKVLISPNQEELVLEDVWEINSKLNLNLYGTDVDTLKLLIKRSQIKNYDYDNEDFLTYLFLLNNLSYYKKLISPIILMEKIRKLSKLTA